MGARLLCFFLVFALVCSIGHIGHAQIPDNPTIIKWAGLSEKDKVEKTVPVVLSDGEKALVAQIKRFKGKNDIYGAYLVRPSLRKAREIQASVQELVAVPNSKADSRFIVIQYGASVRGDPFYSKRMMFFKGWDPVIMAKIDYGQVFQVAAQYASAISCETQADPRNFLPLLPWNNLNDHDERAKAMYALIWHGDIGCEGGTGSSNPHIAIVRISTGDSIVVDPLLSSPVVKFEMPVHHVTGVVKFSEKELLLSANDWGPDDPHCCPSIPIHILVKRDDQGNWNFVNKTRVSR